jgi:hypothetical protein
MLSHPIRSSWLRMRIAWVLPLALLAPISLIGQIQNVYLLGATSTQAVISFEVPDPTNCLVQVSTDPNFTSLVNDTNAILFSGSQNCGRAGSSVLGKTVLFVAGTRTSRPGTDGLMHSLALEANRLHYFRIISQGVDIFTCDPNANCIQTANPPFGNTFPEPSPFNSAAPYNFAWPTIRPGLDRNQWFVDPLTGIPVSMFSGAIPINGPNTGGPLGYGAINSPGLRAFDAANNGNWANVSSGAVMDSAAATNSTANQDSLFVRFTPWCILASTVSAPGTVFACPQGQSTWGTSGGDQAYSGAPDDIQTQIAASCSGSTTSYQFALSLDGVSPATDWQTQSCTSSLATVTFPPTGAASGGSITTPGFPSTQYGTGANATTFGFWFANQATSRLTRPDLQPHTGTLALASGTLTWASGETFRMTSLSVGSYITLVVSSVNTDYRITAVNSPTSITIASPPADGTYNYLYQQVGVLIRKASATTGSLNVDGVKFTEYESAVNTMPIAGFIDVCSTQTVTDSSGIVLRLCSFLEGFGHPIYAIEEVSGKSRFLGITEPPLGGCSTNNCTPGVTSSLNNWNFPFSGLGGSLFLSNTNTWTMPAQDASSNFILLQGTYSPSGSGSCPNNYQEITIVNCSTYPWNNNVTFVNATPKAGADGHDHTPVALASAYNTAQRLINPAIPPFDATRFGTYTAGNLDVVNGWVGLVFTAPSQQDHMAWGISLDSANSLNLVAMWNSYSSYNCRFCTAHFSYSTAGYETLSATVLPVGPGVGFGEFDLQTTTSADNHTTHVCAGITDPNYKSFNGTSNCFDLTLSGMDPCHLTPNATEVAPMYGTCSWNGSYSNLAGITVQVGDLLDDTNDSGEMFRVVLIPSAGVIRVLRAYGTPSVTLGLFGRTSSLTAHTAPWNLREYCSAGSGNNGAQAWFNLNTDPTGQNGTADWAAAISSHEDFWTTGVMAEPSRYRLDSSIGVMTTSPNSFTANEYGPFNGVTAATCASGWCQTHSSVSRDPTNPNYTVDKNPLSSVSIASNTLWSQAATNVTGSLWNITSANVRNGGASWPAAIKIMPLVAWSGGYLLQDISGPASEIDGTSARNWSFCVVYLAGECVGGSSVGDVYLNVPQSGHNGTCGPWDYSRSLCVTTLDAISGGMNQYYFGAIPTGAGSNVTDGRTLRTLSRLFGRYNFESVFSSAHGSSGGQFAFGHSDFYGGGLRNDLFVVKLPPITPADQIARNQFVNLTETVFTSRIGAAAARVRFGYAENGPANAFYCAYNRKEACITNPNPTATNPYYFASDAGQSQVACVSGCTITIPAIPGRVVYYVVDRIDGFGNVIQTSPLKIGLVP